MRQCNNVSNICLDLELTFESLSFNRNLTTATFFFPPQSTIFLRICCLVLVTMSVVTLWSEQKTDVITKLAHPNLATEFCHFSSLRDIWRHGSEKTNQASKRHRQQNVSVSEQGLISIGQIPEGVDRSRLCGHWGAPMGCLWLSSFALDNVVSIRM